MAKFQDNPTTYEQLIENAKLSFNREGDLKKVIEKICFDNGLDKESTWAILECFSQK